MIENKILRTIRGLLAKARGTENEEEATLFAAKAAELLQKHNLEEADLGSEEANAPMVHRLIKSVDTNPWRMAIYGALADLYFSKTYIQYYVEGNKVRKGVTVVGRPHNAELVQSMGEYLIKTTMRLAKQYSKVRKDVLQFEKACGHRIATRILHMAVQSQTPKPQIASQPTNNLPALYKTELELAESIVAGVVTGTYRGGHKMSGSSAESAGRRAGDGVSLQGQIGGSSTRMIGGR